MARRRPRALPGLVAAVTGGARGIGRATAQAFLERGMQVAVGDVDAEAAQRTAAQLGAGAIAVELDVTRRASVRAFLDETEARLGPLDVLVNNAGVMRLGPFVDEDDATTRLHVDVNCHGVLFGIKEALPRMLARGRGHLVNVASASARRAVPGGATYSATKHFVLGVSEAVRLELRGTGVEISCVMPAIVRTQLAAGMPTARGIPMLAPEDVGAAIARTVQRPRFDVYVPASIGPAYGLAGALPRRLHETVTRLLRADRVFTAADQRARRGYEEGIHEAATARDGEPEPGAAGEAST